MLDVQGVCRDHGIAEVDTVQQWRDPGPPITSIVFLAAAYKKCSSFQMARNISFKVYDGTGGYH